MANTEWEPFKQEIEYLYCYEDKTLSEVKKYMESKYDFKKSEQQYQRQLKKWGLRKNHTRPGDWEFIGKRTEKRKRIDNKESEVHVCGIEFRPEKIKKEKHRAAHVSTMDMLTDTPKTPEGVVVCTPVSPGMNLEWNTPLPWLQFIRLLQSSQNVPSLSSLLTIPLPQEVNMYHHIPGQEFMQRLTSIVPWNRLSDPPNISSSSRTAAALMVLMPEDSEMKHLALSLALGNPKQSGRNRLIVELFLLSNNLTSFVYDEMETSDDTRVIELFNKSGWNDVNHIQMLLSTHEPTVEAIMEKLFASSVRLFDRQMHSMSSLEELSGIRNSVKNMLEAGMDPNAIIHTIHGDTVSSLQFAVLLGISGLGLAKLLLSYGADPNFSHNGNSPLGIAAGLEDGGLEFAKVLLSYGANVNLPHNGQSPLGLAVLLRRSGLGLAELLLSYGANPNFSHNGISPLALAARLGDRGLELAKLLLSYGVDVNFPPNGHSALKFAIFSKSKIVSQLLLDHGAILTPSCLCALTGFKEIDDFVINIINAYPDVNVRAGSRALSGLLCAVLFENLDIIPHLLARGADVNELVAVESGNDRGFTTVIGHATQCGKFKVIQLLLSACRNVNPEFDGLPYVSPLVLALEKPISYDVNCPDPAIVRILLQSGVNIEVAGGQGSMTLLERTTKAHFFSWSLQQLLIEHDAQVDRPLSNKKHPFSALFLAIKAKQFDFVELLISRGVRLNDEYSEPPGTVLGAAIESGNTVLVDRLLAAGARVLERNPLERIGSMHTAMYLQQCGILQMILETSGPTILAAALSARDDHLSQYLLEQNADIAKGLTSPQDSKSGSTPLAEAIKAKNFVFAEILLSRGTKVTDHDIAVAICSIDINTGFGFFRRLVSGARGNFPIAMGEAIIHSLEFLGVLREVNVDPTGTPHPCEGYWDDLEEEFEYIVPDPQSALEMAVLKGKEALSLLLHWTTWDPRLTGRALAIAIIFEKFDLVDSLLTCGPDMQQEVIFRSLYDAGASETTEKHEIYTPLQAAVTKQVMPVAKALAESADVDYLGEGARRRTPLQHAVEKGNMELINMLLQHGASVGPVDNSLARDGGATALQLAAIKGYIGIARRLIDLGASVNEAPAESNGRTALQGAAEYGRIDMLQMLFNEGALVVGDGEPHYHKAVELAEHNGHKTAARLLRHFRNLAEVR